MSGFVPFRQNAPFKAHLVERGSASAVDSQPAESTVEERADQVAETPASEPEDGLPKSAEELEALLTAVRAEARDSAEAALGTLREEIEAERAAVTCMMDNIDRARHEWAKEVRSQLGEVLVVGVRQIVSESATLQSEALKQRISEVGERLIGEQMVVLRVPTADVEAAKEMIGEREGWQVVGDDALTAGGCVAETEGGQVDATMGAAMAGLSSSVKDWMDSAEDGEE